MDYSMYFRDILMSLTHESLSQAKGAGVGDEGIGMDNRKVSQGGK